MSDKSTTSYKLNLPPSLARKITPSFDAFTRPAQVTPMIPMAPSAPTAETASAPVSASVSDLEARLMRMKNSVMTRQDVVRSQVRLDLQGLPQSALQGIPQPKPVDPIREAIKSTPILMDEAPRLNLSGDLVPVGFEFDESQLQALAALATQSHGSLIGAAGTGKTTCTKAFVQSIANQVASIDGDYDLRAGREAEGKTHQPRMIPSILLCAFTGRAVRQIKKNFPVNWHTNIMTIHRALRYAPEIYEDMDESGRIVTKRRFVPTHTKGYPMPWEIIIIDESSMVALDLWENFYAAMRPHTRVYMVGDLNQLPPVQGKSIFGYALAKWNIAELTHVHRQKGSQDCIVPNAHRILKGQRPEEGINFRMREISQYPKSAALQVQKIVETLHKADQFNPMYDSIITAVNGGNWESPSAPLGQIPLNEPLSRYFNGFGPDGQPRQRLVIDAGRSRKIFAIGDKVMATKNDYTTGITNGMMGIITDIYRNDRYTGDSRSVGNLEEVQRRTEALLAEQGDLINEELIMRTVANIKPDEKKESSLQGDASHSIVVDFRACEVLASDDDSDDTDRYVTFRTRGEVESLMLAYASTCHKMQGAECPTTIIICHEAFGGRMLTREWLYTACTRASQKILLLYTEKGLAKALSNQSVKGRNLQEKADSFRKLMEAEAMNNGIDLMKSWRADLPNAYRIDAKGNRVYAKAAE